MYIIKEYLTDNIVAIASRKEDAVAMTRARKGNEPVLIIEEV
jgi:hypothetical protein